MGPFVCFRAGPNLTLTLALGFNVFSHVFLCFESSWHILREKGFPSLNFLILNGTAFVCLKADLDLIVGKEFNVFVPMSFLF